MATVYIGSDHAGLELKAALVKRLSEKGHDVHDLGPATAESCDYPVYAKGVCGKVLADAGSAAPGDDPASFGILVCGTGIGMSMAANHIPGIRAALLAGRTDAIPATVLSGAGKREITLSLPNLTADERDIILAGCLINYYAQ